MTKTKRIVRVVTHWHVDSQSHARRNALVATTALTQRRREMVEVEAFLRTCRSRHEVRARTSALG